MNISGCIKKIRTFCIFICLFFFMCFGFAQKSPVNELPSDLHSRSTLLPVYFDKEGNVGSAYFSTRWLPGYIEFSNHTKIPLPNQSLLCNFDKVNNIVYAITDDSKLTPYPIDSVSSFELVGNNKDFRFEKIPWISNNYYLMPIITSSQGYSLYKRLFTKLSQADFANGGYYVTGKKYDEYSDFYEYYITYPGNNSYQKIPLKENSIRRALKSESQLLKEFFSLHENEINEQSLLGIIQYINDKKYPD